MFPSPNTVIPDQHLEALGARIHVFICSQVLFPISSPPRKLSVRVLLRVLTRHLGMIFDHIHLINLVRIAPSAQSPDEHPRHPQLKHWISWFSPSCSLGTRQIQVERKF